MTTPYKKPKDDHRMSLKLEYNKEILTLKLNQGTWHRKDEKYKIAMWLKYIFPYVMKGDGMTIEKCDELLRRHLKLNGLTRYCQYRKRYTTLTKDANMVTFSVAIDSKWSV